MKRIVAATFVSLFLLATGCQEPAITDPVTTPRVITVDKPDGMIVYLHQYDNMDRGNREFVDEKVVVGLDYYQTHPFSRGDIILLEGSSLTDRFTHSISRIVGLPGETIRIENGQIFINDRKLDTFYGTAHRAGLDKASFRIQAESSGANLDVDGMMKILESSMDEVAIPDDHVFVIGDDWFRSIDSRMFGPVPRNLIKGKVMGTCETCSLDMLN